MGWAERQEGLRRVVYGEGMVYAGIFPASRNVPEFERTRRREISGRDWRHLRRKRLNPFTIHNSHLPPLQSPP